MLKDILEQCRDNATVVDAFVKADSVINNSNYKSALCSISGGADSDIMLDLLTKVDVDKKIRYVWFNTGLEYQATKDHIDYLENRYDVEIIRERAIKPIPLCCKEYGQPFLSKQVSTHISSLQSLGFDFKDESYEVLIERYAGCSSDCRDAIKWWCNKQEGKHIEQFGYSIFNINYNKYLKKFLIQNPPHFKISSQCCEYAKKKVSKDILRRDKIRLSIIGIRKSEGGIRSTAYSSCFDKKNSHHAYDRYRPLFWFSEEDKRFYEQTFQIVHSDCYTKWGFTRTGCVGCPYNIKLLNELPIIERYEPQLYKAVTNVFKDSYMYTKQYRRFIADEKRREKGKRRLF